MALTAQALVDVRRYCGYSLSGDGTAAMPYQALVYTTQTYAAMNLDFRLANLSNEEANTITTYFLANLYLRESDIQNAAPNLTADVAGPYKHNRNEITDRMALFKSLRLELCAFLGFDPGPALCNNRLVRG